MLGRHRTSDAGFTLIETLVSVSVIAIVMAGLTALFTNTLSVGNRQDLRQTAIQLASDGLDRARALRGSSVFQGRDLQSTNLQWANAQSDQDAAGRPLPGISSYLTDMVKVSDSLAASGAGATATLSTSPSPTLVGGVRYDRSWYVGSCGQPNDGGPCGKALPQGFVPFYRVVVAVTWPDQKCADQVCSFVTATLVSAASTEPVFTSVPGAQPPRPKTPGPEDGIQGDAVSLQLKSAGGVAPVTWSVVGLPPGLTMTSGGTITGTLSTVGTYDVTVTVTDAVGAKGSVTFPWTVNTRLTVTAPAAPASTVGTNITSVVLDVAGGKPSYAWSATGLPPGLALNSSAGLITGTPTTAGSYQVTVTVSDSDNGKGTATFTWTVTP
jgi:prepilin-type N-terminal cleavage/methylation domain-containing protein